MLNTTKIAINNLENLQKDFISKSSDNIETTIDNSIAQLKFLDGKIEDETYVLKWRNRYLDARVKYLEGRLSETNNGR